MAVRVRVEELLNEISRTEAVIKTASGYYKRDMERHLSKLYKELDAFRRNMRGVRV